MESNLNDSLLEITHELNMHEQSMNELMHELNILKKLVLEFLFVKEKMKIVNLMVSLVSDFLQITPETYWELCNSRDSAYNKAYLVRRIINQSRRDEESLQRYNQMVDNLRCLLAEAQCIPNLFPNV